MTKEARHAVLKSVGAVLTMRPTARRLLLAVLVAISAATAGLWRWAHGSRDFLLCRLVLEYELMTRAPEFEREALSGSSQSYYFTSYYLNGILSAFEATGDERLLRRAIRLMDTMVEASRDFREGDRNFRVWGPYAVSADSPAPRPNLHFTFQAAVPLARAAAIIRSHERLEKRHGRAAQRYIQFVDGSVMRYFFEVQLARDVPWLDTDRFPIWNDNASNLALNAAFLCRATGESRHCELAHRIAEGFKAQLRVYRGGWIWENQTIPIGSDTDNTPGSVGNQAGVPDTSHTNREAFLMQTLHEMGMVYSRSDLERMAETLAATMWNGSLEDPSFSNYLNGDDRAYRVYKAPGLNGSIYHGWALMGAYSPRAQAAMIVTLKAIVKGRMNPSLERNKTSYGGTLALAGHTLRNFGLAWRPRFAARARSAASRPPPATEG